MVGGGGWWVVCKPILVFSLSLGQAEQFYYFMRLNNQSQMRKDYEQVKNRACKVVRIYAKSPYTDLPEKNHQKMVCISLKKSVFWLKGP